MVAEQDTALVRSARKRLALVRIELEIVQAELIVATAALRHQGADQDEEIAMALEFGARGRLGVQVERVAEVIGELGGRVVVNG